MPRCRIAMETGTHSPWVSRLLTELGHEVILAHAQRVRLIAKSRRKDDRVDARTLARLARIDPALLSPVQNCTAGAQLHLAETRARAVLVSARTALINAARGLAKSYGERLQKCYTQQDGREAANGLRAGLREALKPLLQEVESLNERIQEYDRRIARMAKQAYPETALLQQVKATTYVLTIEDPHRFRKSRDAGCFVGLQPGRRDSGGANSRCTSARKETSIYERCWFRERITSWDRLEKTLICDAGGRSTWREKGQETSGRGGSTEVGSTAARVMGELRGVRAAAQ